MTIHCAVPHLWSPAAAGVAPLFDDLDTPLPPLEAPANDDAPSSRSGQLPAGAARYGMSEATRVLYQSQAARYRAEHGEP